ARRALACSTLAVVCRPVGLGGPGLVGPVPLLVEKRSGAVLIIAPAITVHAEAVERIDQPHRQPGGDEQRPTFEARLAEPGGHGHNEPSGDDAHRQPDAYPG